MRPSLLPLLLVLAACSGASGPSADATLSPALAPRIPTLIATEVVPAAPQDESVATVPATSTALPSARITTTAPPATPAPVDTLVPSPAAGLPATPAASATLTPAPIAPAFSYPIAWPGRALGDGFFIRHGYSVENTWYNPHFWHTGEDWYATEADTAGAGVYAVATGEVVYVGSNYPGRVVIVRHAPDLYSMYGHLDPNVAVAVGRLVDRGALLGTVLDRADETPNHLHFEIRTFLTADAVNGAAPLFGFRCGAQCPPGPGYWPFDAPHAGEFGWRNPTHVIARRASVPGAPLPLGQVVVAAAPVSPTLSLWTAPPATDAAASVVRELSLQPGQQFELLEIHVGPEDTRSAGAQSYQLWYRIRLDDGRGGWAQAAVPSTFETGADGSPSAVSFNFYPAVAAP